MQLLPHIENIYHLYFPDLFLLSCGLSRQDPAGTQRPKDVPLWYYFGGDVPDVIGPK